MSDACRGPIKNIPSRQDETPPRYIRVGQDVEAMEIDLSRPRLIRILGRTSKGRSVERHLKITERERLVMVCSEVAGS